MFSAGGALLSRATFHFSVTGAGWLLKGSYKSFSCLKKKKAKLVVARFAISCLEYVVKSCSESVQDLLVRHTAKRVGWELIA